jgi:hypothetical protein
MNQTRDRAGILFLEKAGLNLVAVLDCAVLPETTAQRSCANRTYFGRLPAAGAGGA